MDRFVEDIIEKDINFEILHKDVLCKKDYITLSQKLHKIEKIILKILSKNEDSDHFDILCVELILYLSFLYNVYEHNDIVYPVELPNSFPCYLADRAERSANILKRDKNTLKYDKLVSYFSECYKPTF